MQLGPTESINRPAVIENPQDDSSTAQATQSSETDAQTSTQTQEPVALDRLINRFKSPNTLLLGGVMLMIIIMFRHLRKSHKANAKRANKQASPANRIADIHANAQSTMAPSYKVMNDAEEMARRLGAILDNKAARLELLIEEADAKLNTLNRTLATPTSSTHPPEPNQPITPTRTLDPTVLDRARMEQDHAERQTRVAGRIDPTAQDAPQEPTAPPPQQEPQSTQDRVVELAATGMSTIEIAQQLNEPIGQIELILNLRKQQG